MGWGKIKGEKKGLRKRGGEEKGRGAKALGGFTRGDGGCTGQPGVRELRSAWRHWKLWMSRSTDI